MLGKLSTASAIASCLDAWRAHERFGACRQAVKLTGVSKSSVGMPIKPTAKRRTVGLAREGITRGQIRTNVSNFDWMNSRHIVAVGVSVHRSRVFQDNPH
ncbi:MAG: hypothetical protein AAF539_16100, partial [Planctomycetota bacterium]